LAWFPFEVNGTLDGTVQSLLCGTDWGTVKWNMDEENVNIIQHPNFYNQDFFEMEVLIKLPKSGQNITTIIDYTNRASNSDMVL